MKQKLETSDGPSAVRNRNNSNEKADGLSRLSRPLHATIYDTRFYLVSVVVVTYRGAQRNAGQTTRVIYEAIAGSTFIFFMPSTGV